jgi:PadR family transcriptional regulator, regulatory protein PadR
MPGPLRVTNSLLDVLVVLLRAREADVDVHGWAIMKATRRSGPTIYGVLDRLEDCDWIAGVWEEQEPDSNKPRRRLYRLTPSGATEAAALVSARKPAALSQKTPWSPRLKPPDWLRPRLPDGTQFPGAAP